MPENSSAAEAFCACVAGALDPQPVAAQRVEFCSRREIFFFACKSPEYCAPGGRAETASPEALRIDRGAKVAEFASIVARSWHGLLPRMTGWAQMLVRAPQEKCSFKSALFGISWFTVRTSTLAQCAAKSDGKILERAWHKNRGLTKSFSRSRSGRGGNAEALWSTPIIGANRQGRNLCYRAVESLFQRCRKGIAVTSTTG